LNVVLGRPPSGDSSALLWWELTSGRLGNAFVESTWTGER
jgi:hypothetical protein